MVDFSITHTCGHTVTHDIGINRAKLIRHLAGRPCRDRRDAEIDARNSQSLHEAKELETRIEAVRETSEKVGLPPLVGSLKQIAWAEEIRANTFRHARKTMPEDMPTDAKQDAVQQLSKMVSAKWWIENRGSASLYVKNVLEKARKQLSPH